MVLPSGFDFGLESDGLATGLRGLRLAFGGGLSDDFHNARGFGGFQKGDAGSGGQGGDRTDEQYDDGDREPATGLWERHAKLRWQYDSIRCGEEQGVLQKSHYYRKGGSDTAREWGWNRGGGN